MSLLTEDTLSHVIDLPISLPAMTLKQGDWLTVATVKLVSPMRLRYRFLTLQMMGASITNISDIGDSNRVSSAIDLAFLGLYLNFDNTAHPATQSAIDIVQVRSALDGSATCIPLSQVQGQFVTVRTAAEVIATTPGIYSFVIGNNMKENPSSTGPIPQTTSIDFNLAVTGSVRLELLPQA